VDGLAEPSITGVRGEIAAARATERARLLSPLGRRRWLRIAGLGVLAAGLAAAVLLSLAVGARPVPIGVVIEALTAFDAADTFHLVVHDLRLPRTMVGIAVGLALSVAGALMQAITRNPLADPGLLGVNSGASLAAVIAIWGLHVTSLGTLVWFALAGAGTIAVLVYMLGSLGRGGATPVRLALAGAAINALLFALVSAVLLLSKETLDIYRFWIVGSLTGAAGIVLRDLLPFLAGGLALALIAGRSLNAVALGDDTARALGTRLGLTRVITMMAITLLCGAAVAAAGPIGFVGLVVPHLARAWCGGDQRWLIAYSAILGPIVLVLSDVAGRVVLPPGEVQVGIMTALIGGPLFVGIVRNIRLAQL
jgi:iron complex transport system permease protein